MPIDQQNDEEWKAIMKRKGVLLAQHMNTINKWIVEQDPEQRLALRNKDTAISQEIGEIDRELSEYVDSKGGY